MTEFASRCYRCMQPIVSENDICPHCGHDNNVRTSGYGYLPACVLQNQYLVGHALGRGGFGITYIGYDLMLDRVVAIKEYFPADKSVRINESFSLSAFSDCTEAFREGCARALRESRIAAKVQNIPGVVQIYNAFAANNTIYIVMEYVEGETFTNYIKHRGGRLTWPKLLPLMNPVMDTLIRLHGADIVHRDVKPDNIMIRRSDGMPVLLDFGAAQTVSNVTISHDAIRHSTTRSLGYAPFEQYSSVGAIDGRLDQYALCATMLRALTGDQPLEAISRMLNPDAHAISCTTDNQLTEAARAAILRGFSIQAQDRFDSIAQLKAALNADNAQQSASKTASSSQDTMPLSPFKTSVNSDGTLTITGYNRKDAKVVIPRTIGGKTVTAIGDNAFSHCSYLREVILPDTLIEIGNIAFDFCSSLTEITIPNSVMDLGANAFSHCSSLKRVTLSSRLSHIGTACFDQCTSLTEITIPSSVTEIWDIAFNHCSSLTKVILPHSVTSIGFWAFGRCEALKEVVIPASVTEIEEEAFEESPNVTLIVEQGSCAETYAKSHYIPFRLAKNADSNHISSDTWETEDNGDGTVTIKSYLSSSVQDHLHVPNVIHGKRVTKIGPYAFGYSDSFAQITIPDSVTSIGMRAFQHCRFLRKINIPNSVTSIGEEAFLFCEQLPEIKLPASITEISKGAFSLCESLREISIPDSVAGISDEAFAECEWLKRVLLPDSVISIGREAFRECKSLKEIHIPHTVKFIGEGAFLSCDSLTMIVERGSVAEKYAQQHNIPFQYAAYSGSSAASKSESCASTASGFKKTEDAAKGKAEAKARATAQAKTESKAKKRRLPFFARILILGIGYYFLAPIYQWPIPLSATSYVTVNDYSDGTFGLTSYSGSDKSVTIPETIWGKTISSISYRAFRNSSSTEIILPDSVTSISHNTFFRCTALKQINIPDAVTYIGVEAFQGCSSLSELFIPSSVTTIGNHAFADCPNLTLIVEPGSYIEEYAKKNSIPYQYNN